jgi:hypothetical protein
MKMVKSLLLGSAAGLVAVTAGQAAELPVKAKPVEYVKICSLYGAGFYYMPGTDMCIKIGGWVRAEARWGVNGSSAFGDNNQLANSRATNNFWTRERGYITADAREETAYGVARGYIAVGISSQNSGGEAPSSTFSSNRAFVQWAGFTAGQTISFFDFFSAAPLMINAGQVSSEDTGDPGWWVWAYTAQFGGGFSATLSAEERRVSQIIGLSGATAIAAPIAGVMPASPFATGSGFGGWQSPDIVANLRVDQGWGSAQIMGALHQVNPGYYGTLPTSGHPGDQWGWVAGAGLRLNAPFIAPGDYVISEVNYGEGASRYLNGGENGESQSIVDGSTEAFGISSDCVYGGTVAAGNATGCQLTTGWVFDVGYEHYWTPAWHQSIVGSYLSESYNSSANAMLCANEGFGAGLGTAAVAAAGCNNNWNMWAVGSRLQWDVTKSFYLAVDVLYQKLDSATQPGALNSNVAVPSSSCIATGTLGSPCSAANESNWVVGLRMHKDFLP